MPRLTDEQLRKGEELIVQMREALQADNFNQLASTCSTIVQFTKRSGDLAGWIIRRLVSEEPHLIKQLIRHTFASTQDCFETTEAHETMTRVMAKAGEKAYGPLRRIEKLEDILSATDVIVFLMSALHKTQHLKGISWSMVEDVGPSLVELLHFYCAFSMRLVTAETKCDRPPGRELDLSCMAIVDTLALLRRHPALLDIIEWKPKLWANMFRCIDRSLVHDYGPSNDCIKLAMLTLTYIMGGDLSKVANIRNFRSIFSLNNFNTPRERGDFAFSNSEIADFHYPPVWVCVCGEYWEGESGERKPFYACSLCGASLYCGKKCQTSRESLFSLVSLGLTRDDARLENFS